MADQFHSDRHRQQRGRTRRECKQNLQEARLAEPALSEETEEGGETLCAAKACSQEK